MTQPPLSRLRSLVRGPWPLLARRWRRPLALAVYLGPPLLSWSGIYLSAVQVASSAYLAVAMPLAALWFLRRLFPTTNRGLGAALTGHDDPAHVDERQRLETWQAGHTAHLLTTGLLALCLMYMIVAGWRGWWRPSRQSDWLFLGFGAMFLLEDLPNLILAWTLPEPHPGVGDDDESVVAVG